MKKDTLEEKIFREFDGKFKEGVPPMRIHNSGSEKSWIEHPEIKDWLRTTLQEVYEAGRQDGINSTAPKT